MNTHSTISIEVPEAIAWMIYSHLTVRDSSVILPWHEHQSIKDCLESIGVPHTEVGMYYVNGEPVGESHILESGVTAAVDQVSPEPYAEQTFILDTHLGKLATYLRLLGFDAVYDPDLTPEELAGKTGSGVILTRSRELLKHKEIRKGMLIRSTESEIQLGEVMYRFGLAGRHRLLYRCPNCDGILDAADKEEISDQLEAETIQWVDELYRCPDCGKIYWNGSHYRNLEQVLAAAEDYVFSR